MDVTLDPITDADSPAVSSVPIWPRRLRLISLAVIAVSLLALVRRLPVDGLLAAAESRLEAAGWWGPILFGVVYVVAALLFVPGSAITLAAGALFGMWRGTIIVSVASTIAAALAFLVGRSMARETVRRWAGRSPRFAAIDRAIGVRGWRIVALLRLSPAMPFSLGNYLFGLTSVRFRPYVIASWIAMLPGTFMFVSVGHAGRASLGAIDGSANAPSPVQWVLPGLGLLATIAVTVLVGRIARRAMAETLPDETVTPAAAPGRVGRRGACLTAAAALLLAGTTGCAYARPGLLTSLFGPPRVEMKESFAAKPDGPRFDHARFNEVLAAYVSADGGWVDYDGLAEDHEPLDAYISSLGGAPLDQMGRDERLALLINAYNACTLRLILDHYPLDSIKDIPAAKRWDAQRWVIGGQTWSLSQIEHEQIRANFIEPRIHFALVCAAVGCPPLRPEAYRADRLEEQLDEQARDVHQHERWFRFVAGDRSVHLTSLYLWYGSDFQQTAGSVAMFASGYSAELAEAMRGEHAPGVRYLPYDWSLNHREVAP